LITAARRRGVLFRAMHDLVFVGLALVFFALAAAYAGFCLKVR
jgi:hypothetical protein